MTRLRTHYDNLQVARTASAEVIRAAYRALSQKWHPDKHPGNRREAELVMRILNHAYEVLSDPAKRKEHDRWIARVERGEARAPLDGSAAREGARTRVRDPGVERAAGGYFRYRHLPEVARKRLRARIEGHGGAGAALRAGSVTPNYAWLVLLAGGLWALEALFRAGKWTPATQDLHLPILLVGAIAMAANASRIVRWHLSPLKCHVVLTPLHVVRTRFDEVWARPIWTLSDVEVSPKARRSRSSKTTLRFVFPDARERVTVRDRRQAELFLAALQAFRARIRTALAEEDRGYFIEEDDFVGAEPRSPSRLRRALPSGTAFLVYPVVVLGVLASNESALERNPHSSGILRLVRPPLEAAVASLTRHPQPLPTSGRERRYHRAVSLAPFEIRAHAGTGHYFVEVKDWSSGETVMSVFVREGQSVETTLPVGSYRIEYANGEIWYGRDHLFGPRTRFGRTDRRLDVFETEEGYAGYTVELLPMDEDGARTGARR